MDFGQAVPAFPQPAGFRVLRRCRPELHHGYTPPALGGVLGLRMRRHPPVPFSCDGQLRFAGRGGCGTNRAHFRADVGERSMEVSSPALKKIPVGIRWLSLPVRSAFPGRMLGFLSDHGASPSTFLPDPRRFMPFVKIPGVSSRHPSASSSCRRASYLAWSNGGTSAARAFSCALRLSA